MSKKDKTLKDKTVSGIFWRFGERILAQLITMLVSIMLARVLLPEEYGTVALITIFITLANVLVVNGLGTSLIQKKNADNGDFSTMFYASLVFSLGLYVIIFVSAPIISNMFNNDLTLPLRIMALKLPLASINSIQQAYVTKKMIYKKFFFSTLVGTLASAVIGVYMAYNGFGVWALIVQYLTNSFFDTVVLSLTIGWHPIWYFSMAKFKQLFGYGWKIMASTFIGSFFSQLRGFIIGAKYSSADLAYYNKGDQFPAIINNNMSLTMESVLFSTFSELQNKNKELHNAISRILRTASLLLFPILLGLASAAPAVVEVVLTEKWLPCVPFLRLFCLQYCFALIGIMSLQSIKSIGRSDVVLKLEFIKKPIFLVFLVCGMFFGPLGIAISNVIYDFIGTMINALACAKTVGYSIKKQVSDVFPSFMISVLMAGAVAAIGHVGMGSLTTVVVQISVGVVLYVVLALLFVRKDVLYMKELLCSKIRGNKQ